MIVILILLLVVVFVGLFLAILFFESSSSKKKAQAKYANIVGKEFRLNWGKECYTIFAGGKNWFVEGSGTFPDGLTGKKVRVVKIVGKIMVSVELLV